MVPARAATRSEPLPEIATSLVDRVMAPVVAALMVFSLSVLYQSSVTVTFLLEVT